MCPDRHLCGPIEEADFAEDSECAKFNREVEAKPMTNADRIRAMRELLIGCRSRRKENDYATACSKLGEEGQSVTFAN